MTQQCPACACTFERWNQASGRDGGVNDVMHKKIPLEFDQIKPNKYRRKQFLNM